MDPSIPVPNRTLISALPACLSSTTEHVPSFWIKRKTIWHWSSYKCYFHFNSDTELSNCLNKTELMMFGDSHMYYRYLAIKSHFNWDIYCTRETIAAHFLYEHRARQALLLNVRQPTAVIMNCAQNNLVHAEPLSYISDMMEIFKLINVLKDSKDMLKFIWIETLAVPFSRPKHHRFRENNIIAALNDLVNWNMERIGVPVVKAYDISTYGVCLKRRSSLS